MDDKTIEMEGSHAASRGVAVAAPQGGQLAAQGPTPAQMIQYVMQNGGTIEQLREFLQLQREMEADEARKAFFVAMAEFSAEPIIITKDKENKQFKSMYTGIGNLVNTVRPILSKHGFSVDWNYEQPDGQVKVTCVLSHIMGHAKSVSFTIPPDTSGGGSKNPIQQIKSSQTYARSATFEAVCGLASSDQNGDDDGNGSGESIIKPTKERPPIAGKDFDNAIRAVKLGSYDPVDFRRYYNLTPDQEIVLADAEKAKK